MIREFLESLTPLDFLPSIVFLVSFLLGSIPFGLVTSRKKVEFWPTGFIVLILDALKGAIAIAVATSVGSQYITSLFDSPPVALGTPSNLLMLWSAGLFAVVGHCYSPWTHFKGGKGVATAFGALLILSPPAACAGLIGFLLTFYYKRIPSLSSITGLILASVVYLVLNPMGVHLWVGAGLVFLILARHEENIDALLEDQEPPYFV